MIDHDFVRRLTQEYGGQWGVNHSQRLLNLIDIIGHGLQYDRETVWIAAYLHDWGAYSRWAQEGVDHAVRSVQVVGEFLAQQGFTKDEARPVLECIQFHHGGESDRSLESILLTDADAIDFLGVTGVLREFSKTPRDLRKAYDTCRTRMEKLQTVIILEQSKTLMRERLERMRLLLADFEQETAGCF